MSRVQLVSASAGLLLAFSNFAQAQVQHEIHKLIPSDAARNDSAGRHVAMHDGFVVVSVLGDDDNGSNSGAAVVFNAQTGIELHKLLAPDGSAGDGFSWSIATHSGVVVIGASSDDDNGDSSGSAYVFDAETGGFLFKLVAPDGAAQDFFGTSVATDGQYILVGAPQDDPGGMNAGSVYVFDVTTGVYLRKLTAFDGASEDRFGSSVAIDEGSAVIGSPRDDDAGSSSGSAYVYDASTGAFITKLNAADAAGSDEFGTSVGVRDGVVCVGSPFDDDGGSDSGSAYLLDASNGAQLRKLAPADPASDDSFGYCVAISGSDVVVGAAWDDDTVTASGSAYLFERDSGVQLVKMTASDASIANMAISVAIDAGRIVCGAPYDSEVDQASGAAYLFVAPVPPCPADFTGDGTLDFFDISGFLTAFTSGDPAADFTGDGSFDFFDISAFLTALGEGCP